MTPEMQRLEALKAAIQIAGMTPRQVYNPNALYSQQIPSGPTADEVVKSAKTIMAFLADAEPKPLYETMLATQGTSFDPMVMIFPSGVELLNPYGTGVNYKFTPSNGPIRVRVLDAPDAKRL